MTEPLVPVISKVRNAKLIFGGTAPDYADGVDFACDMKSIKTTPTTASDGEPIELACGTTIPAPVTESFTLNGTGIQRFDNPDGLQAYCELHAGQAVPFFLRYNDGSAPDIKGTISIIRLESGGDVGTNPGDLTYEFDGVGMYTYEYPAPLAEEPAEREELVPAA